MGATIMAPGKNTIKPWSVEIWRIIAIIALSASTIMGAVIIYSVMAFKSNLNVILKGAPVCLKDAAKFDSIAAAQAIGRLDLVSFLLTTGGMLLGLFSLMGFWIIRREARDEAREIALEELRRIVQIYGIEKNGSGTHIENPSRGLARENELGDVPTDPRNVPTAGAEREQPGD